MKNTLNGGKVIKVSISWLKIEQHEKSLDSLFLSLIGLIKIFSCYCPLTDYSVLAQLIPVGLHTTGSAVLPVSSESGEEDQSAPGLLLRTHSAGPVSQTCYYLKGESCYAPWPWMTRLHNAELVNYECGRMNPLLCLRHHRQVILAVKT